MYTYVGAYLKCKYSFKEESREVFGCSKCEKLRIGKDDKFCSKCGIEFTQIKVNKTKIKKQVQYVICEKIKDKLYYPDYVVDNGFDYYVPNLLTKARLVCSGDSYNPTSHEINQETILNCIIALTTEFSSSIDVLENEYGKENVSLVFGALSYS